MLSHTPHRPVLFIDGQEIHSFVQANLNEQVNKSQNLSFTLSDPSLEDMSLSNKKVELYLNKGDGVPIFRGYIRDIKPSDDDIRLRAQDASAFLSGDLTPIVMDEKDNYDGYTLVQFLKEYIDTQINVNETILSTDTLHEMNRPVYMTGERGNRNPYKKIQKQISKQLDDESSVDRADVNSIFKYFLDVIHLGDVSGLTIRKTRSLEGAADFVFTRNDGIVSLSYNERAPPTYAVATTTNEGQKEQIVLKYGNAPSGTRGLDVSGDVQGESRGELREKMISHLILAQEEIMEISLEVSRGYHIGLGNIIRIEVPDSNISGQYRITGKKIQISKSRIKCILKCNNEPVTIPDYL